MSVTAAGQRLTAAVARLRDSLVAAHAQCERARKPRGAASSDRGEPLGPNPHQRRRRVPTGEAGAATLGAILGFNPFAVGGPGTALPGTQSKPKKKSGGGS